MVVLDASKLAVIALKSMQHFRAGFRELSNGHRPHIVTSDAPGLSSNKLDAYARSHAERIFWPLDRTVTYDGAGTPNKL